MKRSPGYALVIVAVLIAGCGQKRDLVLPDAPPQSPEPETVAPAEGASPSED
jgi:predicted small lipoprotein YifL